MSVEKLLEQCRRLYHEKSYLEAIEVCNEILNSDLNNQQALEYKARCLYCLDEDEVAEELLNDALMFYPDSSHYLYLKGDMLMNRDEYGKAGECFERMLEIGAGNPEFIKSQYETCLRLEIDRLIEREKYVDAWKCYNRLLEIQSVHLERSSRISRFKLYVRDHTSRGKKRQYYVMLSSNEAKSQLIEFLAKNGFKSDDESGMIYLIDVVDKTYNTVSTDYIDCEAIISESKFYDKVNYYPRGKIEYREIFDENGNLVYEGYTLYNAPYGFGRAYFADGKLYREGIFDIKGIVQGREYYPSGQLRFEGQWCLTGGYGPNAPCLGDAYSEDGELIYSGKFEIKRGGVGWPMIKKPKGFPPEQKDRPKIEYY